MKRHDNIKQIIDRWMVKNFVTSDFFNDRLIVNFEVYGLRSLYLYTNFPGVVIGKGGRCLDELKEMLKAAKINKDIHVVELGRVRSHEISINRKWF